jgi:hypothetical protein
VKWNELKGSEVKGKRGGGDESLWKRFIGAVSDEKLINDCKRKQ